VLDTLKKMQRFIQKKKKRASKDIPEKDKIQQA
jgi:hypothetical protein